MKVLPILATVLFAVIITFVALFSLEPDVPTTIPTGNVVATGVLEGNMALLYGNCHKKDLPYNIDELSECDTRLIDGTLLITPRSQAYVPGSEIKRVETVNKEYRVRLPVGRYSLWILQNGEVSCGFRTFTTPACGPIIISPGEVLRQSVLLNKAAFITP